MQAAIRTVRSVINEAVAYEFTPGLKVKDRLYVYGVMVNGGELYVMNVEEKWRQVGAEEVELIETIYNYFLRFTNFSEPRNQTDYQTAIQNR